MRSYVKSTYGYTKLRKNFGRQPLFQEVPAHLLDSIQPNVDDQKQYILRNPVHHEVQATMPQSEHDTNTKLVVMHEQGINHIEGGWPRDVHLYNEDHLARHRRRVQHEDGYVNTILNLKPQIEHCIYQNNAIDMYQTYFAGMHHQASIEKYNVQIANLFRDPFQRPVSCIVWTNEKNYRLGAAYSYQEYGSEQGSTPTVCYMWDINKQTAPFHEFTLESSCWRLACSPVTPEVLLAGLDNGTVNIFDIRDGTNAVSKSSVYNSHRGPITGLLYGHSRTNTEFFSGSPDGQCLWWDVRNLTKPTDRLYMSVRHGQNEPSFSNAEGVSCLEFDRGLPTKFLSGTDSGLVITANRMGRSHSETLTSYWCAHSGPVRAVHRSPCTMRMFITCGDWSVRIWSEEVRTAPIIVTRPYRYQLTDVAWAPLRYSSYMAVCEGGVFYYWDILRKQREPVATLQVSKHGLTRVTPQSDGKSIAIGDSHGTVYLLRLSDNMAIPGNQDKQLVHQTYDRETRREHILDNRVKEIRLKIRGEDIAHVDTESIDGDDDLKATGEKYFRIVADELNKMDEQFSRHNILE